MDRRLPPAVSDENVTVTVKWFNSTKGFGFVLAPDGGRDIFLHASIVTQSGNVDLPEGATLMVDLMDTQRGRQVAAIHSVDLSTAVQPTPHIRPARPGGDGDGGASEAPVEGKIKFFDSKKGYGFVAIEDGGRDVFVSARTLERCGLMSLEPEQRVRVRTRMGAKGPMAESIELL